MSQFRERLARATSETKQFRVRTPRLYVTLPSLPASSSSTSQSSGKNCHMLCARELSITWENDSRYWRWTSIPESRFSEVAELLNACWLDIRGKMKTRVLSLKTTYAAYLVYKITENSYGLEVAAKASIRLGTDVRNRWWRPQLEPRLVHQTGLDNSFVIEPAANNSVCLKPPSTFKDDLPQKIEGRVPHERNDGWLEVFLGEFFNDEGEGEIEMQLSETEILNWKRGLIVEGIELRPKEDVLKIEVNETV
ncbi:hypothetical protein ACH5RR_031742 [Cinchona calisaya]|uniref:Uncharacterized protein n=1 Tax=Cinchona calisaya TaxID=153742 RepID=A0ABD2YG53_9GENT